MSYRISLDEIDGCLIVTDGERTVKVERFATDGIREVYGRTAELLDRLKAENAELREELAKARDPQRIGGQADPSSFVYAIEQLREFRWQHATNDEDVIPYINNVAAAHERENAKLRELVEAMPYCMYPPKCLKCPLFSKSDPSIGGVPECKARAKLRELGIEVGE